MSGKRNRRNLLYQLGTAVALSGFAGCIGGNPLTDLSDNQNVTDPPAENGPQTEESTSVATTSTSENTRNGGTLTDNKPVTEPAPQEVDRYLSNASFYNGNLVVGVPFVGVGAGEGDTGLDPAAIKVSTGTEVTWQWASGQKPHALRPVSDGPINSGKPKKGNKVSYSTTLSEPGIYKYYCKPHRREGAKGVVVVEKGDSIGGSGSG